MATQEYEVTFYYPAVNVTVLTYHSEDMASSVVEWAQVTASESGIELNDDYLEVRIEQTGEFV